ncbi:hypothetical protein HRbin36_01631 [bacterium HR36]|nr:hypothetical protein HRbin36_01631 [bacterium HR36]
MNAQGPTFSCLLLPRPIWEQIAAQAVRDWPRECLGMLVGLPDGRVRDAYPIRNAAANPHRFLSEPYSLFAAEKRRRQQGWHLLGFYHSHPGGHPVPSHIDTNPDVNFWLDGSVVSLIVAVRPATEPCAPLLQDMACTPTAAQCAPISLPEPTAGVGLTSRIANHFLEARAYRLYPHRWEAVPLQFDE